MDFDKSKVYLSSLDKYNLELLFEDFTHLNGSPCEKEI